MADRRTREKAEALGYRIEQDRTQLPEVRYIIRDLHAGVRVRVGYASLAEVRRWLDRMEPT